MAAVLRVFGLALATLCVFFVSVRLWLFDSPVAHWLTAAGTAGAVFGSLLYLELGKMPDKLFYLNTFQGFYQRHLRNNAYALTIPCLLLAIILGWALWTSISSEAIALVPDVDEKTVVQVVQLNGQEPKFAGSTTSKTSLTQRLVTGKHRFQFWAEGYEPSEIDIDVGSNFWSRTPRQIPIPFRLAEDLQLRYLGEAAEETQDVADVPTPAEARHLSRRILSLELSSSAPRSIWLRGLDLQVTRVGALQITTFPYKTFGAPGSKPIQGRVTLPAKFGVYPIRLDTKCELGRGIRPDDFRIHAFCEPGHRYWFRLRTTWADMHRQEEDRLHVSGEQTLDLLAEWKDYAKQANDVKVLLSGDPSPLSVAEELKAIKPRRSYSVFLCGVRDIQLGGMAKVVRVPKSKETTLINLLGELDGPTPRPRGFILIDNHTLLVQCADAPSLSDIVKHQGTIAMVEKVCSEILGRK